MNIAEILIDYWNNHNPNTLGDINGYDPENINVIVVELLSWLKLERKRELWIEQGKKTSLKDMELNMNYPWCIDLHNILNADTALAEVFIYENNRLKFNANVTESYKHEARCIAYEQYNPRMIIG